MTPAVRASLLAPPSAAGLALGASCFLAALTPSLIPRTALVQGAVAGLVAGLGYGVGAALDGLWRLLELPRPTTARARRIRGFALAIGVSIAAFALARVTGWQNAVRTAMDMERVESARPAVVGFVGATLAVFVVASGRVMQLVARRIARTLARFMPRRLAAVVGLAATVALVWNLANGVLLRRALRSFDGTYGALDALVDPDTPPPEDPLKVGSEASLLAWEGLGRTGRAYIAGWPDRAEIERLAGSPAREPLRVYAGLNSAEDPAERAALAFDELVRVHAFDRRYIAIIVPTGTGWVDPAGLAPLEVLTRGDIASVAVQYSYLPSWLTLAVDTGYGAETAAAVFECVYGHWRTLPRESRPKLLVFGLSLGSVNAAAALDLYEVIGDPFTGALWAGPPFANPWWRHLAASRRKDSPVWLPRHRADSVVRFMGGAGCPAPEPFTPGPMRVVYLQYASDPIVFFSTDSLWRRPELLRTGAPGLTPELRWVPLVTCVQLAFDMMVATTVPPGRGHVYAATDYMRAWAEVLGSPDWTPEALTLLAGALGSREW